MDLFDSASVLHLLAKPLDRAAHLPQLGALPSILGTQPTERLTLAAERRRGCRRRPQSSVGVHDHGLRRPAYRCPRDPGQERGGLRAGRADADRAQVRARTGVGDVDVVGAARQVLPRARSKPDVSRPGGVRQSAEPVGDVVRAARVRRQGAGSGGDIVPPPPAFAARALAPVAMLSRPRVFDLSAFIPVAMLLSPVVLCKSALVPTPMLSSALLLLRAAVPIAMLLSPDWFP